MGIVPEFAEIAERDALRMAELVELDRWSEAQGDTSSSGMPTGRGSAYASTLHTRNCYHTLEKLHGHADCMLALAVLFAGHLKVS